MPYFTDIYHFLQNHILLMVVLCFSSYIGCQFLAIFLKKKNIVDVPNSRSSHEAITPRGAGICLGGMIMLAWIYWSWQNGHGEFFIVPILAFLAFMFLSFLDDIYSLSSLLRLSAHFIIIIFFLSLSFQNITLMGQYIPDYIPYWVIYIALLFFMVGNINFFNFMDGIDGISGVQCLVVASGVVCLSCFILLPDWMLFLSLVVFAVSAGFLACNWHPSSIFLGDVGSVPLGFLLTILLLQLAIEGYIISAIILNLYYFADPLVTLYRRLMSGQNILTAHRDHCYQRAVINGHSHAKVARWVGYMGLAFILCAILAVFWPWQGLLLAMGICFINMNKMCKKELRN